jgi:hypothetical protein
MGPTEVLATDRYRGYKLTLTQQPNGAVVWSVWTKGAHNRWGDWTLEESGCRHLTVPLKSRDEVVEFLAAVLEELRSRV